MLISLAERLLEVDADLIETAIREELARGEEVITDTVGEETCIFLKGLHGPSGSSPSA
jgi:exodeoxyribonuclease V alpha subunit